MPRTLIVVAGVGLAISFVCLSLAATLAGEELGRIPFSSWPGLFSFNRCDGTDGAEVVGNTREFPWTGGDRVTINVPADVHYKPGEGENVVASGPPEILQHLRVRNGRISLDCWGNDFDERLSVTLPGRTLERFTLNGSGTLTLEEINQPELDISIFGSGEVRANGSAESVDVMIAGSGEAHLAELAIQRLEIGIAGSGEAEVAPKEEAEINIAGSGEIRLLTHPAKLETRIAGSGKIVNVPAPTAPAAP